MLDQIYVLQGFSHVKMRGVDWSSPWEMQNLLLLEYYVANQVM